MSDSIMRMKDVLTRTGLSRSTIYDMVARNVFPTPLKLGKRAIGWRESEFKRWLEERNRIDYNA